MIETSTMPKKNPDDLLSNPRIVKKYQRHFAKYFLPKYCIGVKLAQQIGDEVRVVARLKPLAALSKRTEKTFLIPVGKVEVWRKNIKLYGFIAGKEDK